MHRRTLPDIQVITPAKDIIFLLDDICRNTAMTWSIRTGIQRSCVIHLAAILHGTLSNNVNTYRA